ncbi:MAG: NirD/YgiW/YdeI family stress tolerance protein [Alphaproteobacteria bacterium]|nr:NirD/YgiW/YdeI family stress tolerance protein [Alphaproteobacteria bacterium]
MKSIILSVTAVLMMISGVASAETMDADKPISKVSEVQKMPDDSMVYVQGFIVENLGNEKYTFQDDSGMLTVEIDDDLMQNNAVMPTTMVWIAAEVDKKGNIVELDAEEIQFMPEAQTNASLSAQMSNQ